MSTFEREGYQWRETYFVMFDKARRPSLEKVQELLRGLNPRFELVDAEGDDTGAFDSITVLAPDDFAAVDVSFESGEDVLEQAATLYTELKPSVADAEERAKLARLKELDAHFDLKHFEQTGIGGGPDEDEPEMLDPTALLIVLEGLIEATGGVGIDPQSGTFL